MFVGDDRRLGQGGDAGGERRTGDAAHRRRSARGLHSAGGSADTQASVVDK